MWKCHCCSITTVGSIWRFWESGVFSQYFHCVPVKTAMRDLRRVNAFTIEILCSMWIHVKNNTWNYMKLSCIFFYVSSTTRAEIVRVSVWVLLLHDKMVILHRVTLTHQWVNSLSPSHIHSFSLTSPFFLPVCVHQLKSRTSFLETSPGILRSQWTLSGMKGNNRSELGKVDGRKNKTINIKKGIYGR